MSRQAVKIWNEATYGTFANPSTPTKNTDYIVINLDSDNAFTMRPQTVQHPVRTAEGWNRRKTMVAGQTRLNGKLSTLLYPEQVTFLLNWATLLTSNELGSCTIDHQFHDAANTVLYRRYLGTKVMNLHLSATADSPLIRAEFDLVAQKPQSTNITVADFPDPPASDYPVGTPFCFYHLASPGVLTVSSSRSEFQSLDMTFKNMIDSPFFESPFITRANWCGRDINFSTRLALKGNSDRFAYEATTPDTCSVRLDNGTNHVILQLNTANFMSAVEDALAMDKVHYQTLTFENFYDTSVPGDFSFTYA